MFPTRALRGQLAALCFAVTTFATPPPQPRLRVAGTINGHPVHLVFDTGAEGFILLRPAADRLGLKTVAPPPHAVAAPGQVIGRRTDPCTLAVFGGQTSAVFYVVDAPVNMDFDGVIGWGPLSHNIWLISIPTRQFTALPNVPAEIQSWTALHIVPDRGTLLVEARGPDGRTTGVFIDTGSPDGVALTSEAWRRWKRAHPTQPVTLNSFFTPSVGFVVTEQAWANEIEVGGLTFHDVLVQEADPAATALAGPGALAVLGFGALTRAELVLDGPHHVAYVKTLTDHAAIPDYNRLGAAFIPAGKNNERLVATVVPRTPAAQAGIESGDILLAVDGRDVTHWWSDKDAPGVNQYWKAAAGTEYSLTLRHGAAQRTVKVTLENILGPNGR